MGVVYQCEVSKVAITLSCDISLTISILNDKICVHLHADYMVTSLAVAPVLWGPIVHCLL